MSNSVAYVYKWTHIPTMKWYVGSRTAKKAHPNDGYICSSKLVKTLIMEKSSEWTREIIATGSPADMYLLETTILQLFDARKDLSSFNKNNNDGKFGYAGEHLPAELKEKISNALKGKTKKPMTDAHKANIASANKGKTAWNKGKTTPADVKKKQSMSHIGQGLGRTLKNETKTKISLTEKRTKALNKQMKNQDTINGDTI